MNSSPEDHFSCQLEKQSLAFCKRGRWKLSHFCIRNVNHCLFPENLRFTWPGEAGESFLWESRYTSRIARTRGLISYTIWRYLNKMFERKAIKWALLHNLEEALLVCVLLPLLCVCPAGYLHMNSWAGESKKIQESLLPWLYWSWCGSQGTQPCRSWNWFCSEQQSIYLFFPYSVRLSWCSHWL